jgi:hypothetical protein
MLLLVNRTISKALAYGARKYGINLVWANPTGSGNALFARKGPSSDVLRFEEPLALSISGGGHVRYEERKYGINLGWSSNPVHEWELRGGSPGDPVRRGAVVEIFNTRIRRYVTYGSRNTGINLVWWSKPPDPYKPETRDAFIALQPHVPYGALFFIAHVFHRSAKPWVQSLIYRR